MKKILFFFFVIISMTFFAAEFNTQNKSKKQNKKENTLLSRDKNTNKKDKKDDNLRKKMEIEARKKSERFKKIMKSYEMQAIIKTNKGVLTFYLYPEAAPVNVANFVYLAKNNYYNGLKFHRILSGILIQGGDPKGNGEGSTGYTVIDEIVDWLNFENSGMLAMANSGPNTNSSQFFITMASLPQLSDKYTIIGETVTRDDISIVRVIREDDTIINVEIKGKNIDTFLSNFDEEIKLWESVLKNNK